MFKVTVKGIAGVKAQFESAKKDVRKVTKQELESLAKEWKAASQRDAPVNEGSLKNAISYMGGGDSSFAIVAQKFYAPFMEFGTKGKYQPISGTENIASQFRGMKGGDFGEMLRHIEQWVKRKGIAGTYSVKTRRRTGSKSVQDTQNKQLAFLIAMSILKKGIQPHPYFFKQQEVLWPAMVKRIRQRLELGQGAKVIMPGEVTRPKIITI